MKKISPLILILYTAFTYAQEQRKQFALLTAGNFWKNSYAEAGFAYTFYEEGKIPVVKGFTASVEMRPGDNFIIAPKVGAFAGSIIGFGANALYYTNGDEGSFCLRPEIGINSDILKISYGYNIQVTNSNMKGINGSNFNITIFWHLFGDKP